MTPNFCNHGVATKISWSRKETSFDFASHEVVVFPPAKDFDASLHIDCARSRIDPIKGMSILSQVLSIGAWLDDASAVLHAGGAGTTKPVRPARASNNFPSSIDEFARAYFNRDTKGLSSLNSDELVAPKVKVARQKEYRKVDQ